MAKMLISTLAFLRHAVRVLTLCATPTCYDYWPARVSALGRPALRSHWSALRWADIVCNYLSLRAARPELLLHRRVIFWCHTYVSHSSLSGRLKSWALNRHTTYAEIKYLVDALPSPATTLIDRNASDIYKVWGQTKRPEIDSLFTGTLARGKQPHPVLYGEAELVARSLSVRAVMIGNGAEMPNLANQICKNNHHHSITLVGSLSPHMIVNYMQRSRCLLTQSDWGESFGLSAIKGIACGCEIINTDDDGMPEAIDNCCHIISTKDPGAFKQKMKEARSGQLEAKVNTAQRHLLRYTPTAFAQFWPIAIAMVMS